MPSTPLPSSAVSEPHLAQPLTDRDLDTLFRRARTYRQWQNKPVSDTLLRAVYDLARMAPTSANCSPARFVFIRTAEGKARLKPHLMDGNVDQTMGAPVTVIIAHDEKFYERLPELYPHTDAKSWFDSDEELAAATAFRNGSLQGAYLMLAARAVGLDCGPMSGFDTAGVDREFFTGTTWRSNFLCNLGYGEPDSLGPRDPRLTFDEACQLI